MESKYSIKDLERLTGVKAHTIRVWEQRYNVVCPARTDTNIRLYCDSDLKRLLNVSTLVHNGMKISKVAELSDAERNALVLDSSKYNGNYESQVNGLKIAMLDFNELMFDRILTNSIAQIGSEETFSKVVGSFIQQVGLLWQTNTISLVHEHFASNLIKQKLFVAIDSVFSMNQSDYSKTLVLYLPSGELHELGLLYLNFILRNAGHRVVFLGQSVPIDYLKEVVVRMKADGLVSVFTTTPCSSDLDTYFKSAVDLLDGRDLKWFITGQQIREYDASRLDERFVLTPDIASLKKALFEKLSV
ncbi:MAG: MerR family transcriptional regulator [Bacteroidetes bacterium]|uniref:MerR family transcriptional regulator n=1 Tax=Phaeocystidibacter marisrubri TaxID=1577780 RepID=A0A6L3ZIM9_9FLAO|nr:MerR family transcriptional regulator [Phaeocystidibacter marisrubri]KAB2817754.1 MerR family transcriptional regulator [Phaeocystidibacter marisrubri]TNE30605.1 MAG: MerR family transcriptional regulator [Bacteroidota bacterium]GGH73734.1 MerR family transcriptional regulator [Phaeocystidibacter marisrubri]